MPSFFCYKFWEYYNMIFVSYNVVCIRWYLFPICCLPSLTEPPNLCCDGLRSCTHHLFLLFDMLVLSFFFSFRFYLFIYFFKGFVGLFVLDLCLAEYEYFFVMYQCQHVFLEVFKFFILTDVSTVRGTDDVIPFVCHDDFNTTTTTFYRPYPESVTIHKPITWADGRQSINRPSLTRMVKDDLIHRPWHVSPRFFKEHTS
jgi:hypothetical protein